MSPYVRYLPSASVQTMSHKYSSRHSHQHTDTLKYTHHTHTHLHTLALKLKVNSKLLRLLVLCPVASQDANKIWKTF